MISAAAAASANRVSWPAGKPLARCFNLERGPRSFNPTRAGGRFRPIYDASGARGVPARVVPTAYAGEDWLIAFAEAVLRGDLPARGHRRMLPAARLRDIAVAELIYGHDLSLVQLNGYGLRKLNLERRDCIDTGPGAYPDTALLAQLLYDAQPDAQGILWTSSQADHGDAVILWETRINPALLVERSPPLVLDTRPGLELVRAACEQAGVLLEL